MTASQHQVLRLDIRSQRNQVRAHSAAEIEIIYVILCNQSSKINPVAASCKFLILYEFIQSVHDESSVFYYQTHFPHEPYENTNVSPQGCMNPLSCIIPYKTMPEHAGVCRVNTNPNKRLLWFPVPRHSLKQGVTVWGIFKAAILMFL